MSIWITSFVHKNCAKFRWHGVLIVRDFFYFVTWKLRCRRILSFLLCSFRPNRSAMLYFNFGGCVVLWATLCVEETSKTTYCVRVSGLFCPNRAKLPSNRQKQWHNGFCVSGHYAQIPLLISFARVCESLRVLHDCLRSPLLFIVNQLLKCSIFFIRCEILHIFFFFEFHFSCFHCIIAFVNIFWSIYCK